MDQHNHQQHPYALKAGEGWIYQFGINFTVKSSEVQPGNSAAVFEYTTQRGEEPPRHTHGSEDEMFYVLEGALRFHCGNETFDLEAGGFIFLPRGIEHGYTIRSAEPVRLLVITSPVREGAGGWQGFVADLESGQGKLIAKPSHIK